MIFKVIVHLEHVSGPTQDEDTMIDAFAAAIGRDNTARTPLVLTAQESYDAPESTYVVKLIDA